MKAVTSRWHHVPGCGSRREGQTQESNQRDTSQHWFNSFSFAWSVFSSELCFLRHENQCRKTNASHDMMTLVTPLCQSIWWASVESIFSLVCQNFFLYTTSYRWGVVYIYDIIWCWIHEVYLMCLRSYAWFHYCKQLSTHCLLTWLSIMNSMNIIFVILAYWRLCVAASGQGTSRWNKLKQEIL